MSKSIRLIKISKDLNVGINSLAEFLQKKGHVIEANPNTKVDEDIYQLLLKEFGKDKQIKQQTDEYKKQQSRERKQRETVAIHGYEEETEVTTHHIEEIKTEIPQDRLPNLVVVDKMPVDEFGQVVSPSRSSVGNSVEAPSEEDTPLSDETLTQETLSQPKQSQKNTPEELETNSEEHNSVKSDEENDGDDENHQKTQDTYLEEQSNQEDSPSEDIFRPTTATLKTSINVVGKVDLDAINNKTRPAKKTKAEKRKERTERLQVSGQLKKEQHSSKGGKKVNIEEYSKKTEEHEDGKKKRKRIKKEKIDVEKGYNNEARTRSDVSSSRRSSSRHSKSAISEEDVQKQVKETLARLTSKGGKSKGAKYRREKREAISQRQQEELQQQEKESKILKITEFVTANDLANMMDVPVVQVISTCMSIGMMVSINQRLDAETINIVAEEFGFTTQYVSAEVVEAIAEEEDREEDLQLRAPIVTVMGHVDHGKTSLLDNIRQTNVIAGEAGGITQHIGAYNVKLSDGRRITFLDTPGHEAFTAMRARGAKVTDIAIIIVAADDSVMPQTVEAINHASAAGVPIVFAINKIDKPGANPDKIKEELAQMNYLVESWGGKYQSQEISAKQGLGVDELLEKVLLEAELLELKANPNKKAVGSVIESSLDKGRGYISTVLVENGTLKHGDIVLAGTFHGRIKAMFNERNQRIEEALPATPALILGLNGAPQAGDKFHVLDSEQEAREIAGKREQLQREQGLRTQKLLTLDDIGRRIAIGNFQQLNVIVKGDVDGSVEALSDSLIRLSTEEIQVNVIHKAVGQISESDISLAAASDAIIVGFQVRPSQAARRIAEKEGVDIRLYSIIYDAIDEIKSAMEGMLSPDIREEIVANVEVREVFKISKVGTVAGCMVKDGKIKRNNKIRLIRDGIVVYSGELGSLKRFKDDVKEVASGYECGLNIENYNDIKIGDMIEAFEEIEVKKTL